MFCLHVFSIYSHLKLHVTDFYLAPDGPNRFAAENRLPLRTKVRSEMRNRFPEAPYAYKLLISQVCAVRDVWYNVKHQKHFHIFQLRKALKV